MKIVMIDDEIIALHLLEIKIRKCMADAQIYPYKVPEKALAWLKGGNEPDVAFLDIMLGDKNIDGFAVANEIMALYPKCHLVFVTGDENYMLKAKQMNAEGYLVKPVNIDELRMILERLKQGEGENEERR